MMHCRGRGYAKHAALAVVLAQLFMLNSCVNAHFWGQKHKVQVKLQNLKHKKGA